MINRYKTNQQKYKEIIDYIENHSNMLDDLKKDILSIIGKYKVLISCLEQQEVYDLIDTCTREGNKEILNKQLSYMLSGKVGDRDPDASVFVSEQKDRMKKRHENVYNLD